jgi:hypothetical protein
MTRWTADDMRALRDLYPLGGTRAVYEATGGRHSIDSIRATAWKWSIRCQVPSRRLSSLLALVVECRE